MMSAKLPRGPAIRALLWEDWRRSRLGFAGCAVFGGMLLITIWLTLRSIDHEFNESYLGQALLVVTTLPLILYGTVLIFSHGDHRDLSTKISMRHFVLPVRPAVAAAFHLGYRVATFASLALMLIACTQCAFGVFKWETFVAGLAYAVPLYLLAQCLAWTVGNLGAIPFLVSLGAVPLGLIAFGEAHDDWTRGLSDLTVLVLWFLSTLILAAIAVFGSTSGRFLQFDLGFRAAQFGFLPRKQKGRKRDALNCHTLYEWVRRGYLLPALTLTFTLFALAAIGITIAAAQPKGGMSALAWVLAFAPLYISPAAAVLAGIRVLVDDRRTAQSGLGAYMYSHPLSTQGFALARLRMSVRSVFVNQVFCLGCLVAGSIALAALESKRSGDIIGFLAGHFSSSLLLIAVGHTLLVWSLFWMGIPAIVLWLWYLVVAGACAGLEIGDRQLITTLVAVPAGLFLLTLTGYTLARTVSLKLLRWDFALQTAVIATVAVYLARWFAREYTSLFVSEAETKHFLLLTVALFTAFPILSQPLLVHRLRHR